MTKKEIQHARSKQNGIFFYSNKFPDIGIEASIGDDGEINTGMTHKLLQKLYDYENKAQKNNTIFLIFIFDLLLIIFSIFTKEFYLILGSIYFFIFTSYFRLRFMQKAYQVHLKNSQNLSTAKFHAAEHMAVNAYKKLQRVPSLEEIKKFSRFSKYCGSKDYINRIALFTAISLAISFQAYYDYIAYSIVLLIILVFSLLNEKYNFLRFLQVFVTSKPSDLELEVAIRGLEKLEELEVAIQELEKFEKLEDENISVCHFCVTVTPTLDDME